MNKRDVVLGVLDSSKSLPYIPAAFFLHFPPAFHAGRPAVEKHLDYFRQTGMDFLKIQFESNFPHLAQIQTPDDWAAMPRYKHDFFAGQLEAVKGLVEALHDEAVVIMTLYSPFMCAAHTTSDVLITQHLNENPEKVRTGLEIITDSLLGFVRDCIALGVDGFYTSTQGGEAGRFSAPTTFEQYIQPFDLALMNEVNAACPFNILHVCDYQRDYDDLTPFLKYPGQVVSAPLKAGNQHYTPTEVAYLFGRPFMGGLERLGTIAHGTPDQIRQAAEAVLVSAPDHFILGADCTVPGDTPWDNLKIAIDTAHSHQP